MLAFIIPRRGIKFFLAALPMKNMICNHDESVLQLSFKKKNHSHTKAQVFLLQIYHIYVTPRKMQVVRKI